MSQAINTNTTQPRRSAPRLRVVAPASLTAPALAIVNLDADLIAACAEATRCEDRIRHIDAPTTDVPQAECTAACAGWDDAFARLVDMPATTLAGIRAKAGALRLAIVREFAWAHGGGFFADVDTADCGLDGQIAYALCNDILALGDAA
jgi:hypothetical protein